MQGPESQRLQGLPLCGRGASSIGGRPDAENHKWNRGHSQGINMCHLDRRVNLSVPIAVCCALSSARCINFLLSEFKPLVTRCQSHRRFLSRVAQGPRRGCRKCCFLLTVHRVTRSIGAEVRWGRGS